MPARSSPIRERTRTLPWGLISSSWPTPTFTPILRSIHRSSSREQNSISTKASSTIHAISHFFIAWPGLKPVFPSQTSAAPLPAQTSLDQLLVPATPATARPYFLKEGRRSARTDSRTPKPSLPSVSASPLPHPPADTIRLSFSISVPIDGRSSPNLPSPSHSVPSSVGCLTRT